MKVYDGEDDGQQQAAASRGRESTRNKGTQLAFQGIDIEIVLLVLHSLGEFVAEKQCS